MTRSVLKFMTILSLCAFTAGYAHAESVIEPDYDGEGSRITTKWFEYYSPDNYKSDKDFVVGMRPHHAGALSMSKDYLASKKKSSARLQALAKGIIHNQTFEIGMLNRVEDLINAIDFKNMGADIYQVAEQGLAQKQRFIRMPMPPIQDALNATDHVSAEDVRFAKAMIIHHEGALMMCDDYLANPDTKNGYVERMCLDVLRDQAQEIALMRNIVLNYPGDPDSIKIDPSMIHGMDDMMHHMDMSSVENMSKKKSCNKDKKKHHKMDHKNHKSHHGH